MSEQAGKVLSELQAATGGPPFAEAELAALVDHVDLARNQVVTFFEFVAALAHAHHDDQRPVRILHEMMQQARARDLRT